MVFRVCFIVAIDLFNINIHCIATNTLINRTVIVCCFLEVLRKQKPFQIINYSEDFKSLCDLLWTTCSIFILLSFCFTFATQRHLNATQKELLTLICYKLVFLWKWTKKNKAIKYGSRNMFINLKMNRLMSSIFIWRKNQWPTIHMHDIFELHANSRNNKLTSSSAMTLYV